MSRNPRKNRHAFRPALEGLYLEERVVLNGASAVGAAMVAQVSTPQAIGTLTGQPSASFSAGVSGQFPTAAGTTPITPGTFATGFQNLSTPLLLNPFFVVPMSLGTSGTSPLPTGLLPTGTSFPNGFNNGILAVGSGFPSFGTAAVGFTTNFATTFDTSIMDLDLEFGIVPPNLSVDTAIGLETGTGLGTGLGTGPGTTFLLGSAILPM